MKNIARYLIVGLVALVAFSSAASAYEAQIHDFGGRVIRIGSWDPRAPKEGTATYDRLLEAQEKFNVKIEYVVIGYEQIVEQIIAGVMSGDCPVDMFEAMGDVHYPQLALSGALAPLDDILGDDYFQSLPAAYRGAEGLEQSLRMAGRVYATVGIAAPYNTGVVIVWNKGLFEEAGLPSLYELIENGTWTWEKMREIALKATKDKDGDGQIDQWGLGGEINIPWEGPIPLLVTNGAYPTGVVDGKVKCTLNDEKAIYIFTKMYEMKNVDKSVSPYGLEVGPFNEGKVAMTMVPFWMAGMFDRSTVDYGLAYLPKGPAVDDYIVPLTGMPVMCIPATSKDVKALIDLYHYIYSEDYVLDAMEAVASNQADVESYELSWAMMEGWVNPTVWQRLLYNNGLYNVAVWVTNGEKTPAAALAEMEPQVQAALDAITGK